MCVETHVALYNQATSRASHVCELHVDGLMLCSTLVTFAVGTVAITADISSMNGVAKEVLTVGKAGMAVVGDDGVANTDADADKVTSVSRARREKKERAQARMTAKLEQLEATVKGLALDPTDGLTGVVGSDKDADCGAAGGDVDRVSGFDDVQAVVHDNDIAVSSLGGSGASLHPPWGTRVEDIQVGLWAQYA